MTNSSHTGWKSPKKLIGLACIVGMCGLLSQMGALENVQVQQKTVATTAKSAAGLCKVQVNSGQQRLLSEHLDKRVDALQQWKGIQPDVVPVFCQHVRELAGKLSGSEKHIQGDAYQSLLASQRALSASFGYQLQHAGVPPMAVMKMMAVEMDMPNAKEAQMGANAKGVKLLQSYALRNVTETSALRGETTDALVFELETLAESAKLKSPVAEYISSNLDPNGP